MSSYNDFQLPVKPVAMREVPTWDLWFMEIAIVTAKRSKDPSRQVGCIIVNPKTKIQLAGGYNGMIAGVDETPELWEKPTKYDYVCHAEFNAVILHARIGGHGLDGGTAYTTCFPCLVCARVLIQAGIKRIVVLDGEIAAGYKEEYEKTYRLLVQVGMEITTIDPAI